MVRRNSKLLFSLLLLVGSGRAAVSSNVQWEVRTTGNDNNGGGFVAGATGTDYSQQDAAQYTFADLASANGTTNPCIVTSASHNFVAADVGNIIHISAGTNWSASWYQIVSVAANAATLDRACGSVAALSGGTYFVGGGFATIGLATTNTDSTTIMGLAAGAVTGLIWIKNGTYTLTSTITPANQTISYTGYQATHGDMGTAPLITTATNSTNLFSLPAGAHSYSFDNIQFSNTAATPFDAMNTPSGTVFTRQSKFTGFRAAVNGAATCSLVNVEVVNSTSTTGALICSTTVCYGCYIHDNAGPGAVEQIIFVNSISANNGTSAGAGLEGSGSNIWCLNSDIANNTHDGIRNTGAYTVSADCVFYGNGGFGIQGTGSNDVDIIPYNFGRSNAFGGNTSGARTNFGAAAPGSLLVNTNATQGDLTLTANPFQSTTNFALNGTPGGGVLLAGAGWPGTFPSGNTIGVSNIGAVQTSTGSGSGVASGGHMNSITPASFQ